MAKNCSQCARPLGTQYLRAEHLLFHPACFRCAHCQQALESSFQLKKNRVYHPQCYAQAFGLYCGHCSQPLAGQWMEHQKQKYHPHCYQAHYQPRCVICSQRIDNRYHEDEQGAYHVACFEQHRLDPCDVCSKPLKGKYLQDLWQNRACTHHGGLATRQCHVCARLIGQKTSHGGVQYNDGRVVCGLCRISEVTQPQEIEASRQRVLQQLQAVGFSDIPSYVAVSLGDKRTLNKRMGTSGNCHGFTKTLEKQVGGQVLREHSIFVLFGLPRLMFEGVLAHELLHVWLSENQLTHHSPRDVEGFCNLGAALIYQQDNSPLAQVLLQRMANDADPVYGEGYRKQLKKLQSLGWAQLIAQMKQGPGALTRFLNFTDRFI